MEEQEKPQETGGEEKGNKIVNFLVNVVQGIAIGVAFIIPGFSGGSVAAILGIYEKIVGAVADIFKHFKKSFLYLLPILLGMLIGVAALILPIKWGLEHYPIPTVTLFVGLTLGGLPSITDKMKGGKPSWKHILAYAVPLIAAASLCFIPSAGNVKLFDMNAVGYFLLILIGAVGSCALVVPGISGSMLLLIFGYYEPIVSLITDNLLHGNQVGICIAVLACLAVGLVAGFFAISVLMKYLLKKFPRGTYFAIFGFIVGSIPAVYVSTIAKYPELPSSPWYWIAAVLLLAIGFAISFTLVYYAKKKQKQEKEKQENQENDAAVS